MIRITPREAIRPLYSTKKRKEKRLKEKLKE